MEPLSRFGFLRAVLWRRGVAVVTSIYGFIGLLDFIDVKIVPRLPLSFQQWWTNNYSLPSMEFRTWLLVGLILLVLIVMEGSYRLIRNRDMETWNGVRN